jgi:hypothetical protein
MRQAENAASNISNAATRRPRQPRTTTMGGITTVSGSEIVGTVNSMGGAVVNTIDIDPGYLAGTWLNRQATLYNHYKYVRCAIRFVPFVPTSTMGRLILSWCGDYAQTVSANAAYAAQFANASEVPIWRETSCNFVVPRTPEFTVSSMGESTSWNHPASLLFTRILGRGRRMLQLVACIWIILCSFGVGLLMSQINPLKWLARVSATHGCEIMRGCRRNGRQGSPRHHTTSGYVVEVGIRVCSGLGLDLGFTASGKLDCP